ncbi:hypothetical protein C3L33_03202, partial [Rhododendron williamsianum]
MGGGGDHGHHGDAGDFRTKVWTMTGGPNCRPKHWKRNTAIAMAGVFLICIPIAMKSAELENVNKSHCPLKDKLYLKGLFHRLRALIALNCSLIFVTDGSIPAIKLSTYRRRLKSGTEVTQDETNTQKVAPLRRNMGSEFSCMIKEAKLLGVALGIPSLDGVANEYFNEKRNSIVFLRYICIRLVIGMFTVKGRATSVYVFFWDDKHLGDAIAPSPAQTVLRVEEAEAQCALLNSESLCDGCFSSDSDIFLFGARTVYRDICLGEGGYVVCYEMADIERKLGFGRNSLESACQIVKSAGDNAVLQRLGSEHDLQGEDHFLQVIDAYLKPKCHSADSEVVHRVLALHPFHRIKLQQMCAQVFDWPPEKTDEYILPKIAERDLRRFANLRSTSSKLGVRLPLDKMPVKCPVSGIIKPRKVHGQECFEVSWEEMHGLNTSIVPADLLRGNQSLSGLSFFACPEKILEFEERRAQGKKQNHRKPKPKKSENRAPLKEIDLKLQNLLLDMNLRAMPDRKLL